MPLSAAPPAAPGETPPLQLAGRVGFGMAIWGIPGYSSGGGGALGNVAVGGALLLRWWVTERLALLPSVALSVSHNSVPDTENQFGEIVPGYETTSGTVAPALQLSFAAYQGKTTRFMLSAGPGFGYSVEPNQGAAYPDNSQKPPFEDVQHVSFVVLAGFALEQFFTPRISILVGADSPVFAYSWFKIGDENPTSRVSAEFSSTRLTGAVFFYLD